MTLALKHGLPNPAIFLALAIVGLCALAPFIRLDWLGWWQRPLARLGRHKRTAITIAAASPLLMRALLLPFFPAPEPRIHDEFTLLLAADTFAHGRLINPQHPNWVHFETMHVLARPVYVSAFPIAHAAVLALAKILFGQYWAGVWIGSAFMCGAVCWMLQGWVPPRWALLGALLVVLRFGVSSYWMNSYWGGCVAAGAGALVLGSLPRLRRNPHWTYAVLLGTGLAILANTRPFEGCVFGLLALGLLTVWIYQDGAASRTVLLTQVAVPLGLVLAAAGAFMGFYFAGITGRPWMLPYSLYRDTMSVAPHFVWQNLRPEPLYNNAEMRNFFTGWEINAYMSASTNRLLHFWKTLETYWRFYFGPILTVPLLALPWLWRNPRNRQLVLMAAAFSLALTLEVWRYAHYAAPVTGLAILIVVLGLRMLGVWQWRGANVGLVAARAVPVCCVVFFLFQILAGPAPPDVNNASWRWPSPGGVERARVLRQLEATASMHLVLVRYEKNHDVGDEWVYNFADLDAAKVVWARELDQSSNQNLMQHFSGRQVWLVEPDAVPPRLSSYGAAPPRPMFFVPIGAPGIETIRSEDKVKRRVQEQAASDSGTRMDCSHWNFYFTAATGVEAPPLSKECGAGPILFDEWFSWLKHQT